MKLIRLLALCLGIAGSVIFTGAFAASWTSEHFIGETAREYRIFTGTNALAFLLLTVAVFIRRRAGVHFLPVGLILLLATGVTSYFYLFNQNWLHTIVFGDYVGFAYAAYLGFVFAALGDILLNRARVTTAVLDVVLAPFTVVTPC